MKIIKWNIISINSVFNSSSLELTININIWPLAIKLQLNQDQRKAKIYYPLWKAFCAYVCSSFNNIIEPICYKTHSRGWRQDWSADQWMTYTVRLSCLLCLTVAIRSARKVGIDLAVVTESWLCCFQDGTKHTTTTATLNRELWRTHKYTFLSEGLLEF